ncbi:hypothetical protein QDY71_03100 [Kingella negevensis]|uniref:FixH n=1 Tax=Kingella negevensis TaxID=1522312 RepID=A0A238TFM4_9NEIS|nr:hypothetical protein [Kingella negevensis]MDK4685540.1 hypothetical protein [Kingella negevensis]MDK4696764.1 hypothetical protein [Kingella negevensis]MDK4707949.1 hypothetical protein [Kingella negevensis]MDK4709467.1 hypothetical protein [Kingella negevensis]SNB81792.1 Uncharacterised protein [Kingella negevensis]
MKFQPKWLIATCFLGFAGVKWAAVHWQNQQQAQQPAARVQAACEVAKQGCPFLQQAVFRLQGVRNHNTPFQIVAENVPENVQQISVSFQMTGMDMGFNRFDLVRQANGLWLADKVYLPICAAERHDWIVLWTVDGTQKFQAAFKTQ